MARIGSLLSSRSVCGAAVLIFVTVGNARNPFSRLVRAADAIAEQTDEEVVIQCGHTDVEVFHANIVKFLTMEQYEKIVQDARVIISHAGAGSVIAALAARKRIIVVPRLRRFSEHVNDHQLEIAAELQRVGYVESCTSVDELPRILFRNSSCAPREERRAPLVTYFGRWIDEVFLARHQIEG